MLNTNGRNKESPNRELHLSFINLTKAYDSLPLNKVWKTLHKSTFNIRLIEAIKLLYKGSSSKIKIGNLTTKVFRGTEGLR